MRGGKVQTGCSVLLAVQHIINGISASHIHTFISRENLKKMWTVQALQQVSRKSECKPLIKSSHRMYRIINGRHSIINGTFKTKLLKNAFYKIYHTDFTKNEFKAMRNQPPV